jgi:hypothetical protein
MRMTPPSIQHMLKKIYTRQFVISASLAFGVATAGAQTHTQSGVYKSIEIVNKFILDGKCSDAESVARGTIRPPLLHTILGLNELDCKKNRRAAVNLLTMAASEGESVAIETLSALGAPIPRVSKIMPDNVITERVDNIASPPPHSMSSLPQPKARVLVVPAPVLVVPLYNPNACIQDGGTIFCKR